MATLILAIFHFDAMHFVLKYISEREIFFQRATSSRFHSQFWSDVLRAVRPLWFHAKHVASENNTLLSMDANNNLHQERSQLA